MECWRRAPRRMEAWRSVALQACGRGSMELWRPAIGIEAWIYGALEASCRCSDVKA